LKLDPTNGNVWFITNEPPAINRLTPVANAMTSWSTDPYSGTFDLLQYIGRFRRRITLIGTCRCCVNSSGFMDVLSAGVFGHQMV
jgi:hypothetical protein